ncbi:MAG TPA: site-specific integrase, partial [Candidatus Levybacteria bacterium]|nr:site-specific integrase [Candidatus Levybacteria bacterium]
MELLTLFEKLLLNQKNSPSQNTVKNYVSDIRKFTTWFSQTNARPITATDFSQENIDAFLTQSSLSSRSKERTIASMKKMTQLLHQARVIQKNPFTSKPTQPHEDVWKLREFKHMLFKQKASPLTIKNYLSDLAHFTKWIDAEYGIQKHLTVTEDIILAYKNSLIHILNLSPSSVNRKLSTIRKYMEFGKKEINNTLSTPTKIIGDLPVKPFTLLGTSTLASLNEFRVEDFQYSRIPPIRLLQRMGKLYGHMEEYVAFHTAKLIPGKPNLPTVNLTSHSILHHLRHTRPAWYRRYHTFAITHHLHVGVLSLFCAGLLVFWYAHYVDIPNAEDVLGITQQNRRVLVYSGKLSNRHNLPITQPTELTFSIHSHPSANDSALWKESHKNNPNHDGSFTVQLGRKTTLQDSFFAENHDLYLGMKIGYEAELLPRQRLANVGYSSDSMLLDGMAPITKNPTQPANSILALDSSGNLVIGGSANPVFQASGGDFTVSGTTTILTTNSGSNGNVVLNPDGSGVIDIRKPIVNDSQDASASGSVDFADEVSIATESAGAVLNVHNTGDTGSILSLMSRNVTRMTVDNSGNVGIGTSTPSQLVHIAHTSSPSLRIENLFSGTKLDMTALDTLATLGTGSDTAFGLKTNNLVRMHISPTGNVGIGTTTSTALLDVNGSASIAGSLTFTGGIRNIQSANNNSLIVGGNTTGNIILQPLNGGGFVGISNNSPEYKLDILDTQASRAAMQIFNASNSTDADGLNIRLGNNSSTVHKNNQFITFQTQGLGTIGSISGSTSGSGIAYNTTNADFAEYIKKDPNESIPYGSITCLTPVGTVSVCSQQNTQIVGVTSESPGFVGGKNLGASSIEVGLVGQIETFVSAQNGTIKAGDP